MISPTIKITARDDDAAAREQRIRNRILDGIAAALDELEKPHALRVAIEREAQAVRAASLCRQALCRRAKRCRRQPCKVPAASFGSSRA